MRINAIHPLNAQAGAERPSIACRRKRGTRLVRAGQNSSIMKLIVALALSIPALAGAMGMASCEPNVIGWHSTPSGGTGVWTSKSPL